MTFDSELSDEGNMLLQALDKLYSEYKVQVERVYGSNIPIEEKKGKYDELIEEFRHRADELIGEGQG